MTSGNYSNDFYDSIVAGSLRSARIYIEYLSKFWQPGSVVDVGCGRGTWLAAWAENGVRQLVGLDGAWNSPNQMIDKRICFIATDLEARIVLEEQFDLAMSLEVAEHLDPSTSSMFVASLAALSDAILFSAAFVGQSGENHINTRPHSFWAEQFFQHGYTLFDMFRPKYWSDERIEPWYRQNVFLYVRMAHPLYSLLTAAGHTPIDDSRFTDCIHPWLYGLALGEIQRLRDAIERSDRDDASSRAVAK